jgi:hypothetical protein
VGGCLRQNKTPDLKFKQKDLLLLVILHKGATQGTLNRITFAGNKKVVFL